MRWALNVPPLRRFPPAAFAGHPPGASRRILKALPPGVSAVPLVTLRTGFHAPDGREEALTEYLCDWPGCAVSAYP